jgi:endonuclease/exonuclease/phosphatase family metal-dependent hydrolase
VRLLTFNTLFTGDVRPRLRALATRLDGYDVVCLQEVMYRHNAVLLRRLLPGLRHHAHAGTVVLKGGLVVLSRWPITGYRFVRYPLTAPARTEYLMRKGAQIVSLATDGGELVVVNTHLSANRDDDWSPGNRYTLAQRAEFDRLTAALAGFGAGVPLVVVGDLNVPRESAALAGFLAAAGLRDVLAGDTRPTYRPTPGWPSPPAFDHVLVSPPVRAEAGLVLQEEVRLEDGRHAHLSDHYGVETDVTW